MSFRYVLALFGLAAVGFGGLLIGAGRAADPESVTIRRLLEKQVKDWNRGDLDAFLEAYWHAPGVVFQSGTKRFDGFEALRTRYYNAYKRDKNTMGQLAFSDLEVTQLGPDWALARGRWDLTITDDKRLGGLFTLILRKLPEGWRIVHDHTSS